MSNLRIAGPTPLSPPVLSATAAQMMSHRSAEYEALHAGIVAHLRPFFGTKEHSIYLFTASGTGGMEAAIVNFFSPGDTFLSFPIGVFGQRWVTIAQAFGGNVVTTPFPMGKAIDPEIFAKTLAAHRDARGVMITQCETSTSVVNDIAALARIVRDVLPEALVLVDSISAMGGMACEMDAWGIDVVMSGSQKAWGAPPGVCMIAASKRAKERMEEARMSRYYFDLAIMEKYAQKNQTPATPAVGVLFGLSAALVAMHKEGKEAVFARHLQLRDQLRQGIKALGLALLTEDSIASPTITAIRVPDGVDASTWSKVLKEQYDTVLSGGIGELKGKILRVAHMGWVSEGDINGVLLALEKSLKEIKEIS